MEIFFISTQLSKLFHLRKKKLEPKKSRILIFCRQYSNIKAKAIYGFTFYRVDFLALTANNPIVLED
jgi:hypothetical protein